MTGDRPGVKWFSVAFGAALLFLGYKTFFYSDPRLTADLAAALVRVGRLFFALGALSIAVAVGSRLWRSPKAKILDLLEALGYGGVGVALLAMRGSAKDGGLFESPLLPGVLLIVGLLKIGLAVREMQRRPPPPSGR